MGYTKKNPSDIDFELGMSISTRKIFFIPIDTGVDWYSMWQEIGTLKMLHESINPDFKHGGDGELVEIDGAKFGRRKYERGRNVEGTWVFGAIQRQSEHVERQIFLIPVPNRTR